MQEIDDPRSNEQVIRRTLYRNVVHIVGQKRVFEVAASEGVQSEALDNVYHFITDRVVSYLERRWIDRDDVESGKTTLSAEIEKFNAFLSHIREVNQPTDFFPVKMFLFVAIVNENEELLKKFFGINMAIAYGIYKSIYELAAEDIKSKRE